jgi:predicted NUDIX family NTP pyrophosphohydrolase
VGRIAMPDAKTLGRKSRLNLPKRAGGRRCPMSKQSAGLLLFRRHNAVLEVFLVHPGGPFWAKKDAGAWTIPKGEFSEGEEALAAANRELIEETGQSVTGPFSMLGTIRQAGGKVVHAWAAPADFSAEEIVSNTFEMEWPPRSGRRGRFPEVDRAGWFDIASAREKINPAQQEFLRRLESMQAALPQSPT